MGRSKTPNKKKEFTGGVFSSSSSANNSQQGYNQNNTNQDETIEFTEDDGLNRTVDPLTGTMGSFENHSQPRIENALFREINQSVQKFRQHETGSDLGFEEQVQCCQMGEGHKYAELVSINVQHISESGQRIDLPVFTFSPSEMLGDLSLFIQFLCAHANILLTREKEPEEQVSIVLAPCFTILDLECIQEADTVIIKSSQDKKLTTQKLHSEHLV